MSEKTWSQEKVHAIVEAQKAFFRTGTTLDVSWRIEMLKKLKKAVNSHRALIL